MNRPKGSYNAKLLLLAFLLLVTVGFFAEFHWNHSVEDPSNNHQNFDGLVEKLGLLSGQISQLSGLMQSKSSDDGVRKLVTASAEKTDVSLGLLLQVINTLGKNMASQSENEYQKVIRELSKLELLVTQRQLSSDPLSFSATPSPNIDTAKSNADSSIASLPIPPKRDESNPVSPPLEIVSQSPSSTYCSGGLGNTSYHPDKQCRLLFSITPGRSGSGYLYRVLKLLSESIVDVGHEREPSMGGRTLSAAKNSGLQSSYTTRAKSKIPSIEKVLKTGKIYVETSHMFAATFYDVVLDKFLLEKQCRVDIVVLRRYFPDNYHSLRRLNFEQALSSWYYSPGHRLALTAPIKSKMSTDEKVIGYLIDIEAHVDHIRKLYPAAKMHDVRIEEISSMDGTLALLDRLDLPRPDLSDLLALSGEAVNTRGSSSPGVESVEQEHEILEKLYRYRQEAESQGINLPILPSLMKLFWPDEYWDQEQRMRDVLEISRSPTPYLYADFKTIISRLKPLITAAEIDAIKQSYAINNDIGYREAVDLAIKKGLSIMNNSKAALIPLPSPRPKK